MRRIVGRITIVCVAVLASGAVFGQEPVKPPEDVQKALDYFIGEWTVDLVTPDGVKIKGEYIRKRSLDGHFAVVDSLYTIPVDGTSIKWGRHIVAGWDVATGKLTEWGFGSDGGHGVVRWEIKTRGEFFALQGKYVEVTSAGNETTRQSSVIARSKDEFVYESTNVTDDGESVPGIKGKFTRNK